MLQIGLFLMLVSRKQKNRARRSRDADMILDQEKNDVMIGRGHYEGDDNEFGNSVRTFESPSYEILIDQFKIN